MKPRATLAVLVTAQFLGAAAISPTIADSTSALAASGGEAELAQAVTADVAAARALFDANLDAIRRKDRTAYLATYLDSENLALAGAGGIRLGYAAHAASSSDGNWPDVFQARNLQLVPLRPGAVYGAYRYRVRYGANESAGVSERVFLATPDGWRIAVSSAFESPAGTPPPPVAFVGATLVDGNGGTPIVGAVVVVRAGRIECAGDAQECPPPDGVEVVDVSGSWITPGIVDAHVHFSQTGWADGRPDALDLRERHPYDEVQARLRSASVDLFRSYLAAGVTAVFDVGGYAWTWGLRDTLNSRQPHVAASGPLLSTRDHWLNLPGERQFIYLQDASSARAGVRYLAAHDTDAVKIWFIPDADRDFDEMTRAVEAAADEARKFDLPLVVHATGLREAKVALGAGARLLVHSVHDTLVDDAFLDLARRSKTIYCPTLTVADGYARMYAAVLNGHDPVPDNPNRCADPEFLQRVRDSARHATPELDADRLAAMQSRIGERAATMRANLRRVHEAGIPIAMGTDAGNPLTLHGPAVFAEMEAMQAAGLSPMQTLVASTRGGAEAMGRLAAIGTVEKGKVADLLILGADPTQDIAHMRQLRSVVRAGEIRTQAELAWP